MAHHAFGTVLKVGDGASPEVFTTIAELTKVEGPDRSRDSTNTTNMDVASYSQTFLANPCDHGTIDYEANYLPANATHQALQGSLMIATANSNVKIVHSDAGAAEVLCAGHFIKHKPSASWNAHTTISGSFKISGYPAFTA